MSTEPKLPSIRNIPQWQDIETAPRGTKRMFVVIAINVCIGGPDWRYMTEPYCVCRDAKDGFAKWPHPFPPTHWLSLPEPPKA